jgi:hypothetical protein
MPVSKNISFGYVPTQQWRVATAAKAMPGRGSRLDWMARPHFP